MDRRSSRVPPVAPDHKHHIDRLPRDRLHDLGDVSSAAGGSQDRPALQLDALDGRGRQLDRLARPVIKTFQAVTHADDVLDAVASGELLRQGLDDIVEARAEPSARDDGGLILVGKSFVERF